MAMDAFSASLMADKREIIFAPTVYKFQTFAQMAEEFQLNERDVVLTNEFIYTPFMKELGLKCSFVFQEKFGAGEPSEAMIQTMYDAIPYDSYDRVIAVHQPFTYSRTKMLMDDFAKVLRAADQVVLLPIMGGREKDDGSVRSEDLAAKLPDSVVVDGLEGAAAWVRQNAKKGDLVVCMSCGDLYKAADMMVEK